MKTRTRFIKSVIATAKADATTLPWARGEARRAFIASRQGTRSVTLAKSA